jgi:hypothetical protein
MARGRTARGRARTVRTQVPAARPLLQTTDEGEPIRIGGDIVQAQGDRWVDPFLAANRTALQRLGLTPEVHSSGGLHMLLRPSGRIGAVPLVAPASRRVAAGVLVSPRFRWSALGEVLSGVGFSVAPTLGGGALVPGSAREVPSWLIAGPVVRRLETLLARRRSTFIPRSENRASPRGRVDWAPGPDVRFQLVGGPRCPASSRISPTTLICWPPCGGPWCDSSTTSDPTLPRSRAAS